MINANSIFKTKYMSPQKMATFTKKFQSFMALEKN